MTTALESEPNVKVPYCINQQIILEGQERSIIHRKMPGLKLKSLKEPTEQHDGFRILIARYRPRYLPKFEENWHEWWKELAPSRQLHKEYMIDKKIDWSLYKKRFLSEIKNNPDALDEIKELGQLSRDQDVTLLCHCIGMDKHCHRFVIHELVEKGNQG